MGLGLSGHSAYRAEYYQDHIYIYDLDNIPTRYSVNEVIGKIKCQIVGNLKEKNFLVI